MEHYVDRAAIPFSEGPGACGHEACHWRDLEAEWRDLAPDEAREAARLEAAEKPAAAAAPVGRRTSPAAELRSAQPRGDRRPKHEDRRRAPRLPVALSVRFRVDGTERPARSADVSPGGLFVRSRGGPEAGTHVHVTVDLPDQGPVDLEGEVAWRRRVPPMLSDAHVGFGIRLVGAPAAWTEWLEANA